MNLENSTTESRNPNTMHLDTMTPLEIVIAMNQEDAKVPMAVQKVLPQIAQAVALAASAFERGGRLIYIGAGTSGRLGILDASECPPTFGVPPTMVMGLIAGGEEAIRMPIEGAEDDSKAGRKDLKDIALTAQDMVVGIAASGRTPYVIGGLEYANELGCHTVSVTCNPNSAMSKVAKLAIEAVVGPEVLTGSTRLKAGTAQKLILNMLSTASMVTIGKAYQNLMVDVQLSNEKLHARALNIVVQATGAPREEAKEALAATGGKVKQAVTMILAGVSAQEAAKLLQDAKGHVRQAINDK